VDEMSSIADAAGAAPVELIPMFWASTHVDVMKNIKMRARFFFMADFSAIYFENKIALIQPHRNQGKTDFKKSG
jgi:hypothetical protein